MLRARPCRKIIAAFGHKLEREIGPNAVYPGQIFSKQALKCFANIEGEPIRLSAFAPWRARAICPNILVPSNS